MQFDQVELFVRKGWPLQQIDVIDTRGEAGSADERRPNFERLLKGIRKSRYGIIAISSWERLGRGEVDSAIWEAAARAGTFVAIRDRIYNPASNDHSATITLLSKLAETENDARIRWVMACEWAEANALGFRVPLPTGLIWADPQDPAYVERLTTAGLSKYLEKLDSHQTASHADGRALYVLPYPDAEVALAVELALDWLLETRDLQDVVNRIFATGQEHARWAWPRPGCLPTMRSNRFHPTVAPSWRTGTKHQHFQRLKRWIQNPAFYGTYRYQASASASWLPDISPDAFQVWMKGAFPSFAAPADEQRVARILSQSLWR